MGGKSGTLTVSEWVDAATRGLADEAKDRIRREVEGHYIDALRHNLESGLSDVAAHRAAVAGLGNVRHARRAFRRVHFTKRQAKGLDYLRAPTLWRSLAPPLYGAFAGVLAYARTGETLTLVLAVFFFLPAFLLWSLWLLPRMLQGPFVRVGLSAHIMVMGTYLLLFWSWFLAAYGVPASGTFAAVFGVALLVLFVMFITACASMLRKLGEDASRDG